MSILAPEIRASNPPDHDDVPINLLIKPAGADRVFNGVLAGSSAIVLVLLVAVVVFLCYNGFTAARQAGVRPLHRPDLVAQTGHFGMMSLLAGSIAIALLAVAIATPVSLATALMINEYAPRPLKPWLTGVIDLLATVPSIVYGFWGLLLISNIQAAPARWLVDHATFVPIFRTPSPDQYREVHLRLWADLRHHDHPHHHVDQSRSDGASTPRCVRSGARARGHPVGNGDRRHPAFLAERNTGRDPLGDRKGTRRDDDRRARPLAGKSPHLCTHGTGWPRIDCGADNRELRHRLAHRRRAV